MERISGVQRMALYGTLHRQAWELAEKYGLHGDETLIRIKMRADAEEVFGDTLKNLRPADFNAALIWAENWEDTDYLRRRQERRALKKRRT